MEHCETSGLELAGVLLWIPSRCSHKLDALFNHKINDRRIAHKQLSDIDSEWFVSKFAHLQNFHTNIVEFARRSFNDSKSS